MRNHLKQQQQKRKAMLDELLHRFHRPKEHERVLNLNSVHSMVPNELA